MSQLYWYAQMAYIGGGFSTGVHNVMEPAIARLPIFFGPKYDNSPEAEKLINVSGGFVINNGKDLKNGIEKILNYKNAFMKESNSSTSVIHNRFKRKSSLNLLLGLTSSILANFLISFKQK